MPYKPGAMDQDDRERPFNYVWFSGLCALVTFVNAFIGSEFVLFGWAIGGTVGGLIVATWAHRADDYFQSMANVGLRWMAASIAVYLFAAFTLDMMDVAYSAGYALSKGDEAEPLTRFALFWTDAKTLASFAGVMFHLGYAYAWLRNHFEASGEQ